MTYSAAGQLGNSAPIGGAIVGFFIMAVGIFLIVTPAKHILQSDRRTGYSLYSQELKESGDEKRAVAAAATFYKMCGWFVLTFGAFVFLSMLFAIVTQKTP